MLGWIKSQHFLSVWFVGVISPPVQCSNADLKMRNKKYGILIHPSNILLSCFRARMSGSRSVLPWRKGHKRRLRSTDNTTKLRSTPLCCETERKAMMAPPPERSLERGIRGKCKWPFLPIHRFAAGARETFCSCLAMVLHRVIICVVVSGS